VQHSGIQIAGLFCKHPEVLLRHESLREEAWGNYDNRSRSIRELVCSLRGKIGTSKTLQYILAQHAPG